MDGSPLLGGDNGICALGCAEMAALGAEIFPFNMSCDVAKELTAGIGWTPPVIGKIHPAQETNSFAAYLPGQLSEVEALRVFDLHPAMQDLLVSSGAIMGQTATDQVRPLAGSEMEKYFARKPWTPRVAPELR